MNPSPITRQMNTQYILLDVALVTGSTAIALLIVIAAVIYIDTKRLEKWKQRNNN